VNEPNLLKFVVCKPCVFFVYQSIIACFLNKFTSNFSAVLKRYIIVLDIRIILGSLVKHKINYYYIFIACYVSK